jgi:ABC-type lipoprotein release transport system permease subunit
MEDFEWQALLAALIGAVIGTFLGLLLIHLLRY